ncbi:MAG: Na+/H+ antiporter subunit E [Chlorobi bacterium]|nr:Na+/H+ antiporter subunit E [Chlorobiota bacterium]
MENLSFSSKMSRFLVLWFFLMVLWVLFTASFAAQELLAGLGVSALIAVLSVNVFTCCSLKILYPKSLFYIFVFIIVFTIELVKSNLDVARRVLTPSLPINPGIVKFKTKLKSNFSRMVLANAITLTPGTLSIDLIDDTFYVHWIDVQTTDPEQVHKEIAEKFEKILLKIF